jgi:hypothetical protein
MKWNVLSLLSLEPQSVIELGAVCIVPIPYNDPTKMRTHKRVTEIHPSISKTISSVQALPVQRSLMNLLQTISFLAMSSSGKQKAAALDFSPQKKTRIRTS